MIDLYLVRHAIACNRDPEQWPDDGVRPLTAGGIRKFRRAARGLRGIVPDVDLVLASPLVRARQTAEILRKAAGWPEAVECPELSPGRSPAELLEALRPRQAASIAVVGHEPGLSELFAYLLLGDAARLSFGMKKGGVARLSFEGGVEAGAARLHWILTPGILRVLG